MMVFGSLYKYFPVGLFLSTFVVITLSTGGTVSGLLIATCHAKAISHHRLSPLQQIRSTSDFPRRDRHGMVHILLSPSSPSLNHSARNKDRRLDCSCLGRIRGGGGGGSMGGAKPPVPAVSKWMPLALICATSYALYNLCIKKASSTKPVPMDPLLGGVILQLVAAAMGAGLYVFRNLTAAAEVTTAVNTMKNGVLWSVAAGVSVGMAEILSFVISGMNVKASQSIPTVIGGSVVIGTILGAVWLREQLTLRGWFGVLLISIGIAIVGIDPGTVAAH